jgi:hypothetical protein
VGDVDTLNPLQLTRDAIGARVCALAADLRRGRLPAGAPYRHVNGFTKIVMAERPDGSRLTLHYWPAGGGADDESRPHDHRFRFTSVLLGGEQHFVELEEAPDDPDARPWLRYHYRPYLGGRVAGVTGAGSTALRPVRIVPRRPFEGHYAISSTVVHRAVTGTATACATLVLRGPRERRWSRVYYRPDEPPPRGGVQLGRRLTRDEVLRQLDDVVAMIGA